MPEKQKTTPKKDKGGSKQQIKPQKGMTKKSDLPYSNIQSQPALIEINNQ